MRITFKVPKINTQKFILLFMRMSSINIELHHKNVHNNCSTCRASRKVKFKSKAYVREKNRHNKMISLLRTKIDIFGLHPLCWASMMDQDYRTNQFVA